MLYKRSDTVANALIALLRPFQASFRSLTLDNGGEFADHLSVAAELGRPGGMFFSRPYRASDKGGVAQLNGLIRRRFPKRTDFRTVSSSELDALRDDLNVCPLHLTGGRSPSTSFLICAHDPDLNPVAFGDQTMRGGRFAHSAAPP